MGLSHNSLGENRNKYPVLMLPIYFTDNEFTGQASFALKTPEVEQIALFQQSH